MFDWFKGKKDNSNVVPFPGNSDKQPDPADYGIDREKATPKEKPVTTFYRIGVTDSNRISFQMGYSEITMSKAGAQHLIDQIKVFMEQLDDYDEDGDDE